MLCATVIAFIQLRCCQLTNKKFYEPLNDHKHYLDLFSDMVNIFVKG